MSEVRCCCCGQLFAQEELLKREDTGELFCEDCSGLWADEDLSCVHDEW